MKITRKDASITNIDDEFPGSFEVILSTPDKDRDGDELATEDWKTPLPDHITFDADHGMSVEKTVGSGVPTLEDGKLVVRGTYSSLDRAQEVRTLVKEGHIRTTSVAFMSEKVTKDGKSRTVRELLNGAFVAIPSNREARVLSAKAGARNSASDQQNLQAAHDSIVAAGAMCDGSTPDIDDPAAQPGGDTGPSDTTGAAEGAIGGKGFLTADEARAALGLATELKYATVVKAKYTAEQLRAMLAKGEAMKGPDGEPSYPIGDLADLENAIHAVGRGNADHDSIRAYIIRRAKELGASDQIPDNWNADGSINAKSYTTKEPDFDVAQLAQAVDAALDEGWDLLADVDQKSLPEPVQQALGVFAAAGVSVDKLLQAMNVTNPDEETTSSAEKTVDADALDLQYKALALELAAIG
jgi:hypothetical protein